MMLTPLGAPAAAGSQHNPCSVGGAVGVPHVRSSAAASSLAAPAARAAATMSSSPWAARAPLAATAAATARPPAAALLRRHRRGRRGASTTAAAAAANTPPTGHSAVPPAAGLFDPGMDRDSCGVGFVAELAGPAGAARSVVTDALKMLERMTHRGACGCESNTGEVFVVVVGVCV
jgi:glutamate synthase (NADPH/NADH)